MRGRSLCYKSGGQTGGGVKNILEVAAIDHIKEEHLNWRSGTKDKKKGIVVGKLCRGKICYPVGGIVNGTATV